MSVSHGARRQLRLHEAVETKDFIARPYQIELYEVCKSRNTIVCLNTGCGKTFIAVMLIRHLSPSCLTDGKRTIFLVPLVPLVSQQATVIRAHTDLRVGEYCGTAYDNWTKDMWVEEWQKFDVFVMIDEIFRRVLYQGFISLTKINLIVFDEAHRAVKNHPYREILRAFESCPNDQQPRILGLSASLISNNASPVMLDISIKKLEETMRSTCETASDLRTINKYAAKPCEETIEFVPFNMTISKEVRVLKVIADSCVAFLEDVDYDSLSPKNVNINMKLMLRSIKDTLYVLSTMGVWPAKQVARLYIRELSDTIEMLRSTKSHYTALLSTVLTTLNVVEVQLSALLRDKSKKEKLLDYTSPKLLTLAELLRKYNQSVNTDNTYPSLCGIIFVERRSVAKILCLWLQELVKFNPDEYSHLKADFVLGHGGNSSGSSLSLMSSKKQEEALKKFRSHECNLLVATSVLEEGLDVPRCNLVIRYDPPKTFREYIQSKGRARAERGRYLMMIEKNVLYSKMMANLQKYRTTESILSDSCHNRSTPTDLEIDDSFDDQLMPAYVVSGGARATLNSCIAIINRYCLKLPSDSFTKLTPQYRIEEQGNHRNRFVCRLRLPINSQIRHEIISNPMPNKMLAKKASAQKAVEILHKKKELDDNFLPVGKEAMDFIKELGLEPPDDEIERVEKGPRPGTTKRRQYYNKLVAEVLSKYPIEPEVDCFLYEFEMKLSRPIPEEQNTRGRRITDPAETTKNFGILTTKEVPLICDFPVFTRSGEVTVKLVPVRQSMRLNAQQIDELSAFHSFTFAEVLRLIKYPLQFDPQNANSKHFVVPIEVSDTGSKDIDWQFVSLIKQHKESPPDSASIDERKNFVFDADRYTDAVVIPWYRKDKPQFFFYVAEICYNLSPKSPFPDEGYETFEKYYSGKYNIEILDKNQPLLDVDHTSARLNLLTPRYVNRRGISLPASTAKTKKEKRENLQQKQILIPELCHVHPFPASFWRKAVTLPCLLFRLNSLLVAEQMRRRVAMESSIGIVEPSVRGLVWPPLDFGWILAQTDDELDDKALEPIPRKENEVQPQEEWDFSDDNLPALAIEAAAHNEETNADNGLANDLVIDTFDPSNYVISDDFDDDIGDEFDEEMMYSDMDMEFPINIIGGPNGFSSTTMARNWGFNQSIGPEHQSAHIRELDENNEPIEQNEVVRVGSPSAFGSTAVATVSGDGREWDYEMPTSVFPIGEIDTIPQIEFIQSSDQFNIEGLTKDLANFPVEEFDSFDGSSDFDDVYSDNDDEEEGYDSNVGKSGSLFYNKNQKTKISDILRYELFCESDNETEQTKDPNLKVVKSLYKDVVTEDNIGLKNEEKSECVATNGIESQPNDDNYKNELMELFAPYLEEDDNVMGEFDSDFDSDDPDIEDYQDMRKDIVSEPVFEGNEPQKDKHMNGSDVSSVGFGDLLPDRDTNSESLLAKPFIENFDPLKSDVDKEGPSPALILQALTMSNASDGINLERLETVGDSFLKYAVTAFLYCVCPGIHEGRLSYLRSRQISNMNLYRLGKKITVGKFMNATKFEPNDNWCPPCYAIPDGLEKAVMSSQESKELSVYKTSKFDGTDDDLSVNGVAIPYNLLTQHSIPDKSIADCVEALIGAYLISSGPRGALLFMKWLDLKVMPTDEVPNEDSDDPIWHWLPPPKSPLLLPLDECCTEEENLNRALQELEVLYKGHSLDQFEKKIGYEFKDKAYLVQAFTHNSFYENQVTDCYQRLEFLGDAVLDYLITRYLYEDPAAHSPGTLTDLRSALVNNTFFASLSVKYKFYKHLKMLSYDLFRVVMAFVNKLCPNDDQRTSDLNLFIAEGESENAEDIEVPKALGDIFESVAGAIFLDSGMSLDAVWKVYYRMMKPEIDYFSSHVPKSPIRELLEMEPQNAKFGKPELISGRKIRVCVEVFDFGKFVGVGRNKRIAKCTAAKRALRALKSRQRQ